MANEILSYIEMCQREGTNLQRGMNFGIGGWYSVLLLSVRKNAPYRDRFDEDGTVLIYEGHDEKGRSPEHDPKLDDQPEYTPRGKLTENGKFYHAAQSYRRGERPAELVRVYEKLHEGIWSYNAVSSVVRPTTCTSTISSPMPRAARRSRPRMCNCSAHGTTW